MKTFIQFLKVDRFMQTMLILLALLSSFTFIGLMITMPLLGAWQVISGIVGLCYLRDKAHAIYLVACAIVLSSMGIIVLFMDQYWSFIPVLIFLLIPSVMAIIYLFVTLNTLERVEKDYGENYVLIHRKKQGDPIEDLLDDEIMFV